MKRTLAGAATTLLVAGVAAGCGGDDNKSADSGITTLPIAASISKPEYIARADAVCRETNVKIRAAGAKLRAASKKSGGTLPKSEVAKFFTRTSLPAYDAMVDKLRDLTPPKGDESRIDGFIAAIAGAIDTVKANPVKYTSPNVADPFDAANKRAQEYGMEVCGS